MSNTPGEVSLAVSPGLIQLARVGWTESPALVDLEPGEVVE